ncbi:MAG: hypothetical protein J7M29_11105, partial [Verrucomicrobia bacterium]|nr:hypothetical protein [Verrucomicrobiota bacterium]
MKEQGMKNNRFAVAAGRAGQSRAEQTAALEAVKSGLVRRHTLYAPDTAFVPAIRRAADEAASLAWTTPCPLLVLPLLVEEKVQEARRMVERQQQIRERSRELLA